MESRRVAIGLAGTVVQMDYHRACRVIERKMTVIGLLSLACGIATGIALAAAWLPSEPCPAGVRPLRGSIAKPYKNHQKQDELEWRKGN